MLLPTMSSTGTVEDIYVATPDDEGLTSASAFPGGLIFLEFSKVL